METLLTLPDTSAPTDARRALQTIAESSGRLAVLLEGLDMTLMPEPVRDGLEELRTGLDRLPLVETHVPHESTWLNIWALGQGAAELTTTINEALETNGVDVQELLRTVPGSAPTPCVLDLLTDDALDTLESLQRGVTRLLGDRPRFRAVAGGAAYLLAALADPQQGVKTAMPQAVQDAADDLRGQLWRAGFMYPYLLPEGGFRL